VWSQVATSEAVDNAAGQTEAFRDHHDLLVVITDSEVLTSSTFGCCQIPVCFVKITVTFPVGGKLVPRRRAMDEHVEHVEQVVEELPDYALMVDLPD
jgi:hypothetical protein